MCNSELERVNYVLWVNIVLYLYPIFQGIIRYYLYLIKLQIVFLLETIIIPDCMLLYVIVCYFLGILAKHFID